MLRASKGAHIVITPTSRESSRVWLEVPIGSRDDEMGGYNVVEISVEAADLDAAIQRWNTERAAAKAKVMSHA